jgi:hypothetical protein
MYSVVIPTQWGLRKNVDISDSRKDYRFKKNVKLCLKFVEIEKNIIGSTIPSACLKGLWEEMEARL